MNITNQYKFSMACQCARSCRWELLA